MSTTTAVLALPTNNVLVPMTQVSAIKGAYVQHPHTSARNYAAIQAVFGRKPCDETTPVLVEANTITPLEPFDFFMTPYYKQYHAEIDAQGDYTKCHPISGGQPKGARECVDALVIVVAGDRFVPARMRLKSGKCRLMIGAYEALSAMSTADKKYAPLAKLGLAPYNFLHFTASYTKEVAKASKKAYYVGISTPELTTTDTAKALAAAMKDQEFIAAFNVCVDGYEETKATVESLGG